MHFKLSQMKHLVPALLFLIPFYSLSQNSCLSEGLVMLDQNVATNFATNYPGCTVIEGDVILGDAANFIGMEQVVEIQGVIKCGGDGECNAAAHENFLGLENVVSLGGVNLQGHVFSFAGLESVEVITGNMYVEESTFSNFEGLANLTEIQGNFHTSETNFESFQGLQNLTSLGGYFRVDENETLPNCDFISQLATVGGYFFISDCTILTSFSGFSGLESVGGYFIIDNCPAVSSLQGFESLLSNNGSLTLRSNDVLEDISGIANMDPNGISNLEITQNTLLSQCAVESVCGHLLNWGSNFIESNSPGCITAQEVAEQCVGSLVDQHSPAVFKLLNTQVQEQLQIFNPESIAFSIRNVSGQELLQSNTSGTLSLSELPSAVYVLVTNDGRIYRFVKTER